MTSEADIEQKIQASGASAPRLNPAHIDSQIVDTRYIVPEGTALTLCVLTLRNGFHVVGQSAAASPENFNAEIGREISYKNAREQIWQLEGYVLKSKIAGTI